MAKQVENQKQNLVLGRVVDRLNRPLSNLIVQAFDRNMRSEELLGESITDRNGKAIFTPGAIVPLPLRSSFEITNKQQNPLLLLSVK